MVSCSPVRLPEKLERQRSVSLGSGVEMQKEVLEVTTATGDEDLQSHASSGDDVSISWICVAIILCFGDIALLCFEALF